MVDHHVREKGDGTCLEISSGDLVRKSRSDPVIYNSNDVAAELTRLLHQFTY